MRTARIVAFLSSLSTALVCATPAVAQAQPPAAEQEVETDSDPTRPVFMSLRPEFSAVREGVNQRALIFRYDAAVLPAARLFNGAPGVVLRLEVPLAAAEVPGGSAAGLGDSYGQFFMVPYRSASGRFVWAVGSGVVLPTATDPLTGAGKWVVAPVAAPLWRFPGGMFLIKVQNFSSIAGDRSRPSLNYLLITPLFLRAVGQGPWWLLADLETKTKWTDERRTGVKSGVQVGRRVAPGVGLWVKPEAWWGPNRDGRWNLKFGFIWYQRRQAPDTGASQ